MSEAQCSICSRGLLTEKRAGVTYWCYECYHKNKRQIMAEKKAAMKTARAAAIAAGEIEEFEDTEAEDTEAEDTEETEDQKE